MSKRKVNGGLAIRLARLKEARDALERGDDELMPEGLSEAVNATLARGSATPLRKWLERRGAANTPAAALVAVGGSPDRNSLATAIYEVVVY